MDTNWNTLFLRKEADILKKMHAFRLFKEFGIDYITTSYPKIVDFIWENKSKSITEFETEMRNELQNIKIKEAA